MTPRELAETRVNAEVELVKTVDLGNGELQYWRTKNYMDSGPPAKTRWFP